MKRILMMLLICVLLLTSETGMADEADHWELFALLNGYTPGAFVDYEDYHKYYIEDYEDLQPGSIPEDLKDGWEVEDGILYDTVTQTLLTISDDANPGSTLNVRPGTRYICANALRFNDNIKEIFLPDSVTVIGAKSITGMATNAEGAAVEKIHIPASVRLIQEPLGTFYYSGECSLKPLFVVDENNPRYISTPDGLLIDKLEGVVLWCARMSEPRVVTVPDGIRRIAPYAFAFCDEIVSIQLPDSLIEIGEGAFYMIEGLQEITIPENVLRVGAVCFAFSGNTRWVLDNDNHFYRTYSIYSDDDEVLTAEEMLRLFDIDRNPGITFKGKNFQLMPSSDLIGDSIYKGFESCYLPITIPAGSLFQEYMEMCQEKQYYYVKDQITVTDQP